MYDCRRHLRSKGHAKHRKSKVLGGTDYWAADQMLTTTYTWAFCCMRKTIHVHLGRCQLTMDACTWILSFWYANSQLEHACGIKLLPQAHLSTTAHLKYSTSPLSLSEVLIPILRIWGYQLQWGCPCLVDYLCWRTESHGPLIIQWAQESRLDTVGMSRTELSHGMTLPQWKASRSRAKYYK